MIGRLRAEALKSVLMALKASDNWNARSAELKAKYGGDSAELHIAKRDDLRLKEYMAVYVWHRDNSSWANSMIQMLKGMEVTPNAGVPSPR